MSSRDIIKLGLTIGLLISTSTATAHGTEKHSKMNAADDRMKKLHSMMPMFSRSAANLESALGRGDAASAEAEAGKMLAAIPDLKKARPHKNSNKRKKFVEMTGNLEVAVKETVDFAKRGDFPGARTSFRQVDGACAACHYMFRD